jgi:hypothetical protein
MVNDELKIAVGEFHEEMGSTFNCNTFYIIFKMELIIK